MASIFTTTTKTTTLIFAFFMLISLLKPTSAQLSLGCYASGLMTNGIHDGMAIRIESPIFPGLSQPYHDIYMSQEACTVHCKISLFLFAITEGGSTCYCTNQQVPEGSKVEDSKCNKPCAGYPPETCGSAFLGAEGLIMNGGGAYANVMLVNHSPSIPHIFPSSSSSSPSSPSLSSSQQKVENRGSGLNGNQDLEPSPAPSLTSLPVSTFTTTIVIAERAIGLKPEVRNDAGEIKTFDEDTTDILEDDGKNNGEDEQGNDNMEYIEDAEEDGGDEVEVENEEEDEENEEEDEEDEDRNDGSDNQDPGNAGKTITENDAKSSPGIPVASTAVAVVCALGICAFIVYAARKRKQEHVKRVTACSSSSRRNKNTIGHLGYLPFQQKDLESVSDGQSEVVDRRRSVPMVDRRQRPMLALDTFSRTSGSSIMAPSIAATRNSKVLGRSYSHRVPVGYLHRPSSRSMTLSGPVFYADLYDEAYGQDACEAMAQSSCNSGRTQTRPIGHGGHVSVQLPCRSSRASSPACPIEQQHHYDSPFQDAATVAQYLHGRFYHQQLGPLRPNPTQRHSIHSTPTTSGTLWHRPTVSDYRRPHSISVSGSYLHNVAEERQVPRYRTHVLDENDGEIIDNEVATSKYSRRSTSGTLTGKHSGSLKQHFKRLSTPYVQVIRQQQQQHERQQQQQEQGKQEQQEQQHRIVDMLSCIEEGHGEGANRGGNEYVPAATTERRWSRGLLRNIVGNIHNHNSSSSSGQMNEVHGGEGEEAEPDHRQVHSGSLASFRGLDDLSRPRLRVMNPDDNVCV
ncbi:hypothetical protein BGZ65_011152 [Modicella reniformis]|uniref:WSC domain-containing protein n=1 Tax=Modicella reniformis TaxID=1440133 RepID=A0A9P6M1T5_9FUNG|nr:hypothetical protein BGZ65_011152 [Modicella reniformis]